MFGRKIISLPFLYSSASSWKWWGVILKFPVILTWILIILIFNLFYLSLCLSLCLYISLYIYKRPPCPPNILIVGLWYSEPGEEARGALGYVPTVLSCYIITSTLVILLLPILLLLHLRHLCRPWYQPNALQVRAPLLPLPLGHLWPRVLLRFHTRIHNGSGQNELCNYVLAAEDIRIYLLQACLHHNLWQMWVDPTTVHLPSCLPLVSRCISQWWNTPRVLPISGKTNHISYTKSGNACTNFM